MSYAKILANFSVSQSSAVDTRYQIRRHQPIGTDKMKDLLAQMATDVGATALAASIAALSGTGDDQAFTVGAQYSAQIHVAQGGKFVVVMDYILSTGYDGAPSTEGYVSASTLKEALSEIANYFGATDLGDHIAAI